MAALRQELPSPPSRILTQADSRFSAFFVKFRRRQTEPFAVCTGRNSHHVVKDPAECARILITDAKSNLIDGVVCEPSISRALPTRSCWQYSVGLSPVAFWKRRKNVRSARPARAAMTWRLASRAPFD